MALGSTQPLTEMSTRNVPYGNKRPEGKAGNLTTICEPIVQKMWEPQALSTLMASTVCKANILTFLQKVWELVNVECNFN
jgi:hypothetical protein